MTVLIDVYSRSGSIHELLVYQAAILSDAYVDAGVEVTFNDVGRNWQSIKETASTTFGIGGVIQRVVQGEDSPWTIVSVNTQYPLFWLVTEPTIERIEDLRGKRIAGRPFDSAPSVFMRIIFKQHGINLSEECTYVVDRHRDGIEWLRNGAVAATHVGTNKLPFDLEQDGYHLLAFYGDEFQTTTSGLAVNTNLHGVTTDDVTKIVSAHRSTLRRLHDDRELALRAIKELKPAIDQPHVERMYDDYIHPYWTTDGRPDWEIAERSLQQISTELGFTHPPDVTDLYYVP